jgi:hypothetical protein
MGILACYTMLNDAELAKLTAAEPEDMSEILEGFNETHEILDIDKMWDGLHYLLTGESASTPLEDDPISEAIVGVSNLNEDDFIAYTPHEDLDILIEALSLIDFPKLIETFDPELFDKADIYPTIWRKEDKARLFNELQDTFNKLLIFYRQAAMEKMNIVVSIY